MARFPGVAVILLLLLLTPAGPGLDAGDDTSRADVPLSASGSAAVTDGPRAVLGDGALAPARLGRPWGPREQLGPGWQRRYEGGMLYWSSATGVVGLGNGVVLDAYRSAGGPLSTLGFPVSPDAPALVTSGAPAGGVTARVALLQRGLLVAPTATGAVAVTGPEFDAYQRLHGPAGPLGVPTSAPVDVAGGRVAMFGGGSVYVGTDGRPWVLLDPLRQAYEQRGGPAGELGWPTADPVAVPDGLTAAFQKGALTLSSASGAVTVGPAAPPAAGPAAPPAPSRLVTTAAGSVTRSYYLTMNAAPGRDQARARETACADARRGVSGLRVLAMGAQETPGIRRPGLPATWTGPHLSYDAAAAVARAWIGGFLDCRPEGVSATIALGTNNYQWASPDTGAAGGAKWARFVDRVASWSEGRGHAGLVVVGANDIEPSWGPVDAARAWVKAYVSTTARPLIAFASADGCPQTGSRGTSCNNGWTVADVHYVSTGAGPRVYAVPQIYRTDGFMARQWARVSEWGLASGRGPVRFAGVMTQWEACRTSTGCAGIDNTPQGAWEQLRGALAGVRGAGAESLPGPTDIGWMR